MLENNSPLDSRISAYLENRTSVPSQTKDRLPYCTLKRLKFPKLGVPLLEHTTVSMQFPSGPTGDASTGLGDHGTDLHMWHVLPAVLRVIRSLISDPGVSCLLSASVKL